MTTGGTRRRVPVIKAHCIKWHGQTDQTHLLPGKGTLNQAAESDINQTRPQIPKVQSQSQSQSRSGWMAGPFDPWDLGLGNMEARGKIGEDEMQCNPAIDIGRHALCCNRLR